MTVRELQAKLAKLDPNAAVICWTEDERIVGPAGSAALEIESVEMNEGVRLRHPDGTIGVRWECSRNSAKLAVLSVTGDV